MLARKLIDVSNVLIDVVHRQVARAAAAAAAKRVTATSLLLHLGLTAQRQILDLARNHRAVKARVKAAVKAASARAETALEAESDVHIGLLPFLQERKEDVDLLQYRPYQSAAAAVIVALCPALHLPHLDTVVAAHQAVAEAAAEAVAVVALAHLLALHPFHAAAAVAAQVTNSVVMNYQTLLEIQNKKWTAACVKCNDSNS